MNNTAVVFGGTGLVGRELVSELQSGSAFDKIILVVRNLFPVLNPKIELLHARDFSKLASFRNELQASAYFCCIGTTIRKAGSRKAFRDVDLEIPVYIAQLARELSIPHLVVISSIGANVFSRNFYLRTKGEMENLLTRIYSGNLKIIRPSLLVGNRNEFRSGEKFFILMMGVMNRFLSGSFIKYRSILARDVAKAMVKAIDIPAEKVILESDELQKMADAGDAAL